MLDKTNAKVINKLIKVCPSGYKVFELDELQKFLQLDKKELDESLKFLKDNEFLDIKYTDDSVICLSLLAKAKVQEETQVDKGYSIKTVLKAILWSGIFSGIMAFLGSCLARLIIR